MRATCLSKLTARFFACLTCRCACAGTARERTPRRIKNVPRFIAPPKPSLARHTKHNDGRLQANDAEHLQGAVKGADRPKRTHRFSWLRFRACANRAGWTVERWAGRDFQ